MTPLDKNYLSLQFWNKVYQKNGTEFQVFFEGIMERAYPGFQKIKPYGKEGDKGNDGYRPSEGIYYQVYAPTSPGEKEADAAEKFKEDFAKLKGGWDKISTISELNFVYNDKGSGLTVKLEGARAELKSANPNIEFKIFTPKKLEEVFFSLTSDQKLSLGFDVDSRNAIKTVRGYLARLDAELDKESATFVLRALGNIRDIIAGQNDEGLFLDFEILEARALQKNEDVDAARGKYEGIAKRYPSDPRAILYLAEIYLNDHDFEKNNELLQQAERVDLDFWLLRLEKLIREIRVGTKIDPLSVNEETFPDEPRARSNFYRIYSVILGGAGDAVRAECFIERALQLNPDRFSNYDAKLFIMENRVVSEQDKEKRREMADSVLEEVQSVENRFDEGGALSLRSQSLLNIRRLHMYALKEDYSSLEDVAKKTFGLVLGCYLDHLTEEVIADLIHHVELPPAELQRLKEHLKQAKNPITDVLAKIVLLQFLHKKTLFTDGKAFFREIKKENIVGFIAAVEENRYEQVIAFLKDDLPFAVDFAIAIKEPAELRMKVVASLPDDGSIQKDKLFLLLYFEEGNLDEAFEILQKMDLSKLSYVECLTTLRVAEEKKAWDSVIVLLEKLLDHEKDERAAIEIKLRLFTANFKLENFREVIRIGKSILENPKETSLLDDHNKEIVVAQTTYAYLKRSDPEVVNFVETNSSSLKSFESKISAQAETYLKHGDAKKTLWSVVEAIKVLKHPTPEQYGMLFLVFSKIGNMMPDFRMTSSEEITPGLFVKLKGQERWFYLGDGDELDATKIAESDEKYAAFVGKKAGDKISFLNKYGSKNPEYTIEIIFPIEKYICWKSTYNAQKLTEEHRWDAMEAIEVPMMEGSIDTKYLIARLEDEAKKRGEFFNLYCEQNIPLAFLALNEGGLANAVGRIMNEQRGFIRATAGSVQELNQQKEVAGKMAAGEPFYLDGTSALMLSETGLLAKIYTFVPGLRVSQSVISLLFEIKDKFEYVPGQTGYMGYVNGRITFSPINREERHAIKTNFEDCIKLLESKPQNISAISSASKSDAFSEQKIAAGLADACIFAQKEGFAVLTEDFLYLKANEIETKKPAPEYCSSITLLRVLYEQGKVSFEEYLNHFAYLSSYRVRLLPFAVEDLEKAVFSDQTVKVVRPEELRKFNFPLTLSEEYGVQPRVAFQVVGKFLMRVLIDDSVVPEMAEKIFVEIISTFPTKQNRKSFGRVLLAVIVQAINRNPLQLIIGARVQEKVDAIVTFLKNYGPGELFVLR